MNREEIIKKLLDNGITIKQNITIDDNYHDVTSRIDGTQHLRIYGSYLKKLNLSSEEYKFLFPDAPLSAKLDKTRTIKGNINRKYTSEQKEKMKERISGDKNPNSKKNTTEEIRKSRSPQSKTFIGKNKK